MSSSSPPILDAEQLRQVVAAAGLPKEKKYEAKLLYDS
jgi:hypothetical protein